MPRRFTDRAAFDGETLTGTFAVPSGAASVRVKLADGFKTATVDATPNGDGTWTANAPAAQMAGFTGATRWVVYAEDSDGTYAVETGIIYIRPLVSKYRAVVAAIENALQNWAANPNKQISVGEMSISYKDRDELLDILAYYRSRADADERGRAPAGGVQIVRTRFA